MLGTRPPESFNESLGIYPAKGTADDDSDYLVKRAASDTRPLSCKKCDNKIFAGSVSHVMTPLIAKHADKQQEGFVKGGQGVNNLITVDCHSRALDAAAVLLGPSPVESVPLLVLFDFAAAFPSMAHAFIFISLKYYEVPDGMYNFFMALYKGNKLYAMFGGVRHFLYDILSGILQGYLASGSLFVLAIDPFLRMLTSKLVGARTKAFADDLATMVRELRQTRIVAECFDRLSAITGLTLKPKKCKLLPLGAEFTNDRKAQIQAYIESDVPQWREFQITNSGEYLGFQVGHAGGTEASWKKPLAEVWSQSWRVRSVWSVGVERHWDIQGQDNDANLLHRADMRTNIGIPRG